MNMKGAEQKVDTSARLEKVKKQPTVKTGIVSGGQMQEEINRVMDRSPTSSRTYSRGWAEPESSQYT